MSEQEFHNIYQRRRYRFSQLDNTEDLELYKHGGFHPVLIGDLFANGRYKVLHKLGFGRSSTVWLARDQRPQGQSSDTLVTLKVISAHQSTKPKDEVTELVIPFKLDAFIRASPDVSYSTRHNVQVVKDHFMEEGPNGTHLCIVYQFSGPSLSSLSDCPGRVCGSRRLRSDLARKVAKQTAAVVQLMHSAGFVHGDLTTSNILFQLPDQARRWSDNEIYATLGKPKTENVVMLDPSMSGACAPKELVASVDATCFLSLQENITVINFGQSFAINCPPKDFRPYALLNYYSSPELETWSENRFSPASDIWALACTIFEIRAGFGLFDTFFGSHAGSIREKLQEIGEQDDPPEADEGPMIETIGTRLEEGEVELLVDLLEKMLQHRPEERITIQEVVQHPWFSYTEV